ncbi:DUF4124 domain-containing protein [Marinobacter lutaoensis]|jgi:uncharacterized iron-regulated membrane protein|uniref:DUF4124 domain-containing protein n=1 Tax=Marinobacter lutaoensis TaxID=135739 RepID=A0A1V2DWU7_9GAMM|nr:DUF4124 domain-containing protein [Marinobacter lutaoensis]NVD35633.1 DUF4124 domain-containing protein [Marinobacter lutaoensis]ONF44741.1 DUF4124 domain-containing protein [Marinobacter lutaoensis]|tara:strand:- start:47 stop:523 length:477 start_codon:yes stop_codon:yes gene_type:complete
MNRKILMFLSLLAIAAPGLAFSGSVYKWTDENGITHFGDRQPTGQQAERISVRAGSAASPSQPSAPQEQLKALQEQQEQQAVSDRRQAQLDAMRKQREANCAMARANLDIIDSNARIRVEENGEARYLSPEEIATEREKYQRIVDENCGPQAPDADLR